jgi:hypothetical protein
MVRSVLLAGLETVPFTCDLLHTLEIFHVKCLRSLLCGDACIKHVHILNDGSSHTSYVAKTNTHVRQQLHVPTIASTLRERRITWLQSMVNSGSKAFPTFAALFGITIWEHGSQLTSAGQLTSTSNPWLRQYFDDLDALAHVNASFKHEWQQHHWGAIFSQSFLQSKTHALQSYVEPSPNALRLTTADLTLPGLQRTKPYVMTTAGDAWMALPPAPALDRKAASSPVKKQRISPPTTSAASTDRKYQSTVGKNIAHIEARVRALEGEIHDALSLPADDTIAQAMITSGVEYQNAIPNRFQ